MVMSLGDIHVATISDALFVGVYCIIFALFLNIERKSKSPVRSRLTYPLTFLFVLCTAFICLDFTQQFITLVRYVLYLA